MKKSALLYVLMCIVAMAAKAQVCEPVSDFEEDENSPLGLFLW